MSTGLPKGKTRRGHELDICICRIYGGSQNFPPSNTKNKNREWKIKTSEVFYDIYFNHMLEKSDAETQDQRGAGGRHLHVPG